MDGDNYQEVEMVENIKIQTLRGAVDLDALGQTMMHEHVFFWNWGEENKRSASIAHARQELARLAACGANTLVDVGPLPTRNIAWYEDLAPQVDINIILSTGFYLENYTPEPYLSLSEAACMERFRQELYQGISGSGVRAGLIKAASNRATLTAWEEKVLRAAGKVQHETGVPVCLHSCEGARSQFDLLVKAGADPERLYFSHIEAEFGWEGRSLREEARYLEAICKEGGSLFFNNFLFEFDTPVEDMMYLMHYLLDRGYLNRLLFGMDVNFNIDDGGRIWAEAEKEHPETRARTWEAIYTGFIPLLKRWGFTSEHINTILVDNPQNMFGTTKI
jgi:predicted metal-dependent phosphotriesterase family hydrolase